MFPTILIVLLSVSTIALGILFLRAHRRCSEISKTHAELTERFQGIQDVEAEKQRVLSGLEADRARLQSEIMQAQTARGQAIRHLEEQRQATVAEVQKLHSDIARLRTELSGLDEEANLQSFGFYKPHYDFANSEEYQWKLEEIRGQQKMMLQLKTAAVCSTEWQVNGSVVEGRKQISQTLRLILRAFNGESDAAIAKVKYNNIHVMEARIEKAWNAINRLAEVQQCSITPTYLDLKLQELHLAHEYQEKLQGEREEQRRIREQMREEEMALREMERARQEAERDEKRYEEALRKAREEVERAVGEKQQRLLAQIADLQRRLEEARANKERAIARAQMTRSGHVYIISNIGSFGENVYKIGMTRRLDPLDRVRELGDASVPFLFDVHAIIYSDDAPALEAALHRAFYERRVNRVNDRKEFFRVTIDEITEIVRQNHGHIELTRVAEAEEFRKTLAMLGQQGAHTPSITTKDSEIAGTVWQPAKNSPVNPRPDDPSANASAASGATYRVIDADGQLSPPVEEAHLLDLARQGFLTPSTQIVDSRTGHAFVAGEHPGLRSLLQG